MIKEVESILVWGESLIKKYGLIVGVCLGGYLFIKALWFWIILPILAIIAFSPFIPFHLGIIQIVCGWVFIFSLLKKLGGVIFE